MNQPISRRTMLRGLGISLALPWLEAMSPRGIVASAATPPLPKRIAFIYIPNGVRLDTWFPKTEGKNFDLPASLEPLAVMKSEITVLGGLDRAFVPGTGVHAQCGACWLTSSPPSETKDGGFPTNTSLDQLIARQIGRESLLPSLELSCNDHSDNKETKYFESISWYGPGYAANVEKNPQAVFQRLFGKLKGSSNSRSVLDLLLDDSKQLRKELSPHDRRKLDEYLESIRSTEKRIQTAEKVAIQNGKPPIEEPKGIPQDRGDYIRLMIDLMVLAFQQDRTRVASLVIDPERWDSPRMYHGVFDKPQNHHVLTHTKSDEAKEKIAKIDRFHVEQFAYFVQKLQSIREGNGTLLDQSAAVVGSGISDGDKHLYSDLPIVVAGRAGGALKTGFYKNYPGKIPLANLWLTLARAFGSDQPRFADSTGPLNDLLA